ATAMQRRLREFAAEVPSISGGRAEEVGTVLGPPREEQTRLLDVGSGGMLTAFGEKSLEFSTEVGRITEHAVKAIEAKGFTFTRTMMDNSEQIARLINEASENTTAAVARSIKDLADSADAAAKGASATVTR